MLAQVFNDTSLSCDEIKYNLAKVFMQFIEPKKQIEIMKKSSIAEEYKKQEEAAMMRSEPKEKKKREKKEGSSRGWDQVQHFEFCEAVIKHGKKPKLIAEALSNRDYQQIINHAHYFKAKFNLEKATEVERMAHEIYWKSK